MLEKKQDTFFKNSSLYAWLFFMLSLSACTIPEKYQSGKPFVYKTTVAVNADSLSPEEKQLFRSELYNQADDSLKPRSTLALTLAPFRGIYYRMKSPPVFDSANIYRSITFMRNLLIAKGYFKDSIGFTTRIDTNTRKNKKGELKTHITFTVTPGKLVKLDSISYDSINHPELRSLTLASLGEAVIKKGEAFSKPLIGAELDRLVSLYRDKGYMRFTRDELVAFWDTVDISLLRPVLDPFEQFEFLEKLRLRRENPTANIDIRLNPKLDRNRLIKYYVGNTLIYPEGIEDTAGMLKKVIDSSFTVAYRTNQFKSHLLPENFYFKRGDVYNYSSYNRAINRFNSLGAWRLVTIDQKPRDKSDTVDFIVKLSPALRYTRTTNLEGSNNASSFTGNLLGIGVNFSFLDRNFLRGYNQLSTNFRLGYELGRDDISRFIQTSNISLGQNISFPRLIPFIKRLKLLPDRVRENGKSLLSVSGSIINRRGYYNIKSLSASWGYDYQWKHKTKDWKNKQLTVRLPNLDYIFFNPTQAFRDSLDQNPSLKNIFNQGLIVSINANYTITTLKKKSSSQLRLGFEESGLLGGLIPTPFIRDELYRYVKLDAEYKKYFDFKKNKLALRLFGGVGIPIPWKDGNPEKNAALPFVKAFFGGGPNSMRAWKIRTLGPGGHVGTLKNGDRFGDIQFEANAEYRAHVATVYGVKLQIAPFVDMGNIWTYRSLDALENGRFGTNWKDIAVAIGAGVRLDFDYFLIRLDFGYKALDPSPENPDKKNKFASYTIKDGLRPQLGINYPF
jgi:outer membrane protein insertion porin family